MQYILGKHNRIVRQYARNRGYCVTDRGNKTLFKCKTLAEAEAFIDANPEGMSIHHGPWQQELWDQLKAGITVTPLQHGMGNNTTFYRSSWSNMASRIRTAGHHLEQFGEGDKASYRLIRNGAAN